MVNTMPADDLEITYPFQNCNVLPLKFGNDISNFFPPHFIEHVIYLSIVGFKLNRASKMDHWQRKKSGHQQWCWFYHSLTLKQQRNMKSLLVENPPILHGDYHDLNA